MNSSKKVLCAVLYTIIFAAVFLAVAFAIDLFPTVAQAQTADDLQPAQVSVDLDKTIAGISATDAISLLNPDDKNIYGFPTGDSLYTLYIEKGSHTLSVFTKDHLGYYTVLCAVYPCATGQTPSLTPTGIFTIGDKEPWHVWSHGMRSPYASTYFTTANKFGGLFIHGPIYWTEDYDTLTLGSVTTIGYNATSGCIRTVGEAARFVYEKCPEGTSVVIVEGAPLGMTPDASAEIENELLKPKIPRFALDGNDIDSISFDEPVYELEVGETISPTVTVVPSELSDAHFYWTCNNSDVLQITDGRLTALAVGTALVTARTVDGKVMATATVNVRMAQVDTDAAPPDVTISDFTHDDTIYDVEDEDDGEIVEYHPINSNRINLTLDDFRVAINERAYKLLDMLGNGFQLSKAKSCAYSGYDKTYTYSFENGFIQIFTVPMLEGIDTLCEVYVEGDCGYDIVTDDGITIGDALEDVTAAYGSSYTVESVLAFDGSSGFSRVIYWAGQANLPGVPYIYFTVNDSTGEVVGIGIFSARNFG